MKGYKNIFSRDYAVSEVVGSILLVLIAVVAFSAIYMYLFPPAPDLQTSVKIVGDVNDEGLIVLYHKGGTALTDYNIIVRDYPNGTLIGSAKIKDDYWKIDTYRYPLELVNINNIKLLNETDRMEVVVYNINSDGSQDQIFSGILNGNQPFSSQSTYTGDLMLISSLRTNTTDEDLICFNNTINASISASTYIYRWMVNGNPLAEFLMPFNTNSNTTTRDYSSNEYNGTVFDCAWAENGVVGGAYHFGGSKEHIKIESLLTPCFNNFDNNDFTISIWVNSSFMDQDNKIILEGRKDTQNFARLYQENNSFHFGVSVDNTKYAVRTEEILSNNWYHVAAVWDASEKYLAIYTNGVCSTIRGEKSFSCGSHDGITLGHGNSGSGGYWYGYLDEVQIYGRILSDEQIYQIYLNQKNGLSNKEVIVSEETNEGEIWQCIVTPNDGTQDDIPVTSNPLQIIPYGGGK